MRQVTVTCDGCKKSRVHFDYAKFKNFKKNYVLDGWVIDKDIDFCCEACEMIWKEDKKYAGLRAKRKAERSVPLTKSE